MKRFSWLFIFLLISVVCFSQRKPGKAPFLKSFNPQKLSKSLTQNFASDSEKVYSIYCWITRHIRYDVKGATRGPYPSFDPKVVLRRRKAVCLGYSVLFNELCKHAGIQAEEVSGAVRKSVYADTDTVFHGHHSWNAVYYSERWHLLDVTFASGYVGWYPTFKSRFIHFFNKKKPIRLVKKFRRQRHDFYYCTKPEHLIFDHLPDDPAWQMLRCTVPVDSFQLNSVAVCRALRNNSGCTNYPDSVTAFSVRDSALKQLQGGLRAAKFNPRNHVLVSLGYHNYGVKVFHEAADQSQGLDYRLRKCREAIALFDSATKYHQVSLNELAEELDMRNRRLDREKQAAMQFYGGLMKTFRTCAGHLRVHPKHPQRVSKTIDKLNRELQKQLDNCTKTGVFERPLHTRPFDERLNHLTDTMSLMRDTLEKTLQFHFTSSLQNLNSEWDWISFQPYPVHLPHEEIFCSDSLPKPNSQILREHLSAAALQASGMTFSADSLFLLYFRLRYDYTREAARRLEKESNRTNAQLHDSIIPYIFFKPLLDIASTNSIHEFFTDDLRASAARCKSLDKYCRLLLKNELFTIRDEKKTARFDCSSFSANSRKNLQLSRSALASAKKLERQLVQKIERERKK